MNKNKKIIAIKNFINNQKGSTLLIVIIATMFIGTLGTLVLATSLSNLQMKVVDSRSKKNFYYVERAVDEIYNGIAVQAMEYTRTAYMDTLTTLVSYDVSASAFQSIDNTTANINFRKKYYEQVKAAYSVGEVTLKASLEQYISEESGQKARIESIGEVVTEGTDADPKPYIIKDVRVSYTNSLGYYTSINTDIIIKAPDNEIDFTAATDTDWDEVFSYIAIANSSLDFACNTDVNGNLYAGIGGIAVHSPSKKIKVDAKVSNLVTQGTLSTQYGTLNVEGKGSNTAQIFAKNIKTLGKYTTADGYKSGSMDHLSIDATCVVADDLEINGDGSNVLVKGAYYGYGITTSGDFDSETRVGSIGVSTGEGSSSILVNGKNSDVTVNVSDLLIAGRAYVDLRGNSDSGTYMTGESISVKGDQVAYLADLSGVAGMNNPMGKDEYDPSKLPAGVTAILVDDLYYFYTTEKDTPNAQTALFKDYYETDAKKRLMQARVEKLGVDNLVINASNAYTTANIVQVHSGTLDDATYKANSGSFYTTPAKVVADLGYRYLAITTKLYDYRGKQEIGKKVVSSKAPTASLTGTAYTQYIKHSEVQALPDDLIEDTMYAYEKEDGSLGSRNVHLVVCNGDYSVPVDKHAGIIIASGSVEVTENFRGIIFSGGKVSVYHGGSTAVDLVADMPMVKDLFDTFEFSDGTRIAEFLVGYINTTGDSGDGVDGIGYDDLVNYENWEKNLMETES